MKKSLIFIVLIALILVVAFLIILVLFYPFKNIRLNPNDKEFEKCHTLEYNGDSMINIVFFSKKGAAEKYIGLFNKVEPFKSNKNEFNFFYIDSYNPECKIYKNIALLCYSKNLIKKAGSCPNDYIAVVKEKDRKIRSSSYMNVISLNLNHPENVFLHEFGHSFANLAEEYVPGKIPRNSKNCVSRCYKFGEVSEGCYKGCSKSSYYRSIENGIMRTLTSNDFGIFNNKLIVEKMNKNFKRGIQAFAVKENRVCSKEYYYLIEGFFDNVKNEVSVINRTIEKGCIGKNGAGSFKYKMILENDSILITEEFNPQFIFTDAPGENKINGEVFESDRPFLLKIPVIENSKKLEIIKDEKVISEINLNDTGGYPCRR